MVFDEETAPIVRKIFQWKIEGLSLPAIADRLDAMNAPNPEFQKYQVGVRTGNATAKKIWNKSSLTTILDNPHYVGDTVLGRTLNAIYKGVKNQHIDREEWIVFPNTHEAIISREDFQKVREMRDAAARTRVEKMERTEEIRATLINLFEDKIVCADCGRKLYFHRKRVDKRKDGAWYAFYECSSSVKRGNLCTPHYTRQDKLELERYAKDKGYEVAAAVAADGISGVHTEGIMNFLLNEAKRQDIGTILTRDTSRISRDTSSFMRFERKFRENGIRFEYLSKPDNELPVTPMMEAFAAAYKKRRTKNGKRA